MNWSWGIAHLSAVATMIAVVVMLRQKRSPPSTVAWLLAMILLPYIGVTLFLVFGGRKLRQAHMRQSQLCLVCDSRPISRRGGDVELLLEGYNIPAATGGNAVRQHTSGQTAFAALIALIDSATESICIAVFVLQADATGKVILQHLTKRAAAGIKVRLLLDGLGCMRLSRRVLAPLREAGGEVEFFMPVWRLPLRGRSNLRNHRKIAIQDQRRVIAGGMNIGREYMGPTPEPQRWHDISFELEGPAVQQYLNIFYSDWNFALGQSLPIPQMAKSEHVDEPGGEVVQVVPSGPDMKHDALYDTIVSLIYWAKHRLWIVTPYFVPDERLVHALCVAARRGVDVRVLTPQRSNHRSADMARGYFLRQLQGAGGTVLMYQPGMVHAKALLMDDTLSMIGSANMDLRSLFLNYEVAQFGYSSAQVQNIETWFLKLEEKSKQGLDQPTWISDLLESLVRMFAPLL